MNGKKDKFSYSRGGGRTQSLTRLRAAVAAGTAETTDAESEDEYQHNKGHGVRQQMNDVILVYKQASNWW